MSTCANFDRLSAKFDTTKKGLRISTLSTLALSLGGFLLSCGPVHGIRPLAPEDQTSGRVNGPELPPRFELTALGQRARHFNGWFIVLDPLIDVETMSHVITSARDFHRDYARILALYAGSLNPLAKKSADLAEESRLLRAEVTSQQRPRRMEAAADWLSNFVASSTGRFDAEDSGRITQSFGYFCEAKIWEWATSKLNLEKKYSTRPTPSALCEGYYQQRGILQSSLCLVDRAGTNYFSCIWRDGVLKTSLALHMRNLSVIAGIDDAVVEDTIRNRLVSQAILRQARVVRIGDRNYDFSFDGQKQLSDSDAKWENLSPTAVLQTFTLTNLADISADAVRFVSLNRSRTAEAMDLVQNLRSDIKTLTGELNELAFNAPVTQRETGTLNAANESASDFEKCQSLGGKFVCEILAFQESQESLEMQNRIENEVRQVAQKRQSFEETLKAMVSQNEASALRMSESVTAPHSTAVVLPLQRFGLSTQAHGSNGIQISMALASTTPERGVLSGCVNGSGQNEQCDSLLRSQDRSWSDAHFGEDSSIELHRDFGSWQDLGLNRHAWDGDVHNPELVLLDDATLSRARFSTTLYPARWEKVLDTLSGEFTLEPEGGGVLKGVILLMDSDVTKENVVFVQ